MKYIYTSLGINIGLIAISLALNSFLPPVVPMFYGRAVGDGQLVKSYFLAIPLGAALIMTLVNLGLYKWIVKDLFLKKVLTYSSLFITLLALITVIKIFFLVGLF